MSRIFLGAVLSLILMLPAAARVLPYPPSFKARMIATNGTSLYVRVGGHGPAVVLLHGFGDSGDMWQPLAAQLSNPKTWHFNFYGPDEERLVKGRERIFLDRFYNELSDDPKRIDEQTRAHYAALYARPHAMHDAMEQFKAFLIDAKDNPAMLSAGGKLPMPVLALGGEKSYGAGMKSELDFVASNVTGGVIPIAATGSWKRTRTRR